MDRFVKASAPSTADEQAAAWFRKHFFDISGDGVKVAVVDSGWRSDWKDPLVLAGFSISAVSGGGPPIVRHGADDRLGHGSLCSLLLKEIAPKVAVLPIRVFEDRLESSAALVAAAVDVATYEGAQVINLSLSSRNLRGMQNLYKACERANAAGAIVVASSDRKDKGYPATFDNVVGVGGCRTPARLAYEQSLSPHLDFAANVYTYVNLPTRARQPIVGTSMAAPVVAGIVALLQSAKVLASRGDAVAWLDENVPVLTGSGVIA